MAEGKIFINYRREDSRADAGRLYDRLHELYPTKVFRDVGSLEPGIEWRDAINKVLGDSDACIVVIGKSWLTVTDARGKRRLDDPRDTVRQELQTALNSGIRVFPVLVGGAQMPAEADLPEDLQALARRNALEITEQDWNEDFAKLVRALERALGWTSKLPEKSRAAWHIVSGAAVFAVVLVIGAVLVSAVWEKKPGATEIAQAPPPPSFAPAPKIEAPRAPRESEPTKTETPQPVRPERVKRPAAPSTTDYKIAAPPEPPIVPADVVEPPPPRRAPMVEKARATDAVRIQVIHRHGFNYRVARCEGWLTIERNGTVSYECNPESPHDGRCDRVTFPPGSFTYTAADDDQLHLSTSKGKYDFFGQESRIAAAVRALGNAVPQDLRD